MRSRKEVTQPFPSLGLLCSSFPGVLYDTLISILGCCCAMTLLFAPNVSCHTCTVQGVWDLISLGIGMMLVRIWHINIAEFALSVCNVPCQEPWYLSPHHRVHVQWSELIILAAVHRIVRESVTAGLQLTACASRNCRRHCGHADGLLYVCCCLLTATTGCRCLRHYWLCCCKLGRVSTP